ncbi:MAG TPA: hypothetical protein VJ810_41865 [Blastocatellia bacterium]|nr:hypothetical protein [Blastocatellia bacterium]
MKNKLLTCAVLIVLFTPVLAAGQKLSDYCHVYAIDMKVAEKAFMKCPAGNEQEDAKLLESGTIIVGRFSPKIGEEELTTKTFKLPGRDRVITASVFYTDEMMYSTRSDTQNSMLISIAVSKKAKDSAFEAKNSAITEITYTEHTDTIRVKTLARTQGRRWLIGLECRCNREFDETDLNRQAK